MQFTSCSRLAIALGTIGFGSFITLSGSGFAQTVPDVFVPSSVRVDDRPFMRGNMGRAVDIDGDHLIVGYGGDFAQLGGADIYRREGSNWVFDAFINVANVDSEDEGFAVAIDGTRAVLGSPFTDSDSAIEGVAVWEKIGSTWTYIGSPVASQPVFARYGESVDISGDTVIVGAADAGYISIYRYDGTAWSTELGFATAPSLGGGTGMGRTVAVDGDVAVAGAWLNATHQLMIYRRTGSIWNEDQALSVSDFGTLAQQGYTSTGFNVALDGNTILVHAVGPPSNPGTEPIVCVLEDNGSGFEYQYSIAPHDRERPDSFGFHIALDGDDALISSQDDAPDGAVYLFSRENGVFVEKTKFLPTGEGVTSLGLSPNFGSSVGLSNGSMVFGADHDHSFPANGVGNFYVIDPPMLASTIQAICAGNGNLGPTCANCPCGNNASTDSLGGCLNSAGTSAILSMLGETRASADSMRLEVTRAQPMSIALLVSSSQLLPLNPGVTGCFRGSGVQSMALDGLRCIGGGMQRHGTRTTNDRGSAGDQNDGWGGPFAPAGGLIAQGGFAMGQNRFFQAIYRDDSAAGCGTGLNTTNAISAMVLP